MRFILWFSLILAVGTYISGSVSDPDLWWHITAGRWMLAHRDIPDVDYWSMFGVGQPWRAYSWPTEIIFAYVDAHFGMRGLVVLQLLFSVGVAVSLFYCYGRIARDWFFGALLGVFATAACFNHLTLRPQTLVWIFFAWLLAAVDVLSESKAKSVSGLISRHKGATASIFFVMMLWANTHITTILGLAAVGSWLLRSKEDLPKALAITAIGFAGTLITPYLGGEWLTFFSKTGHPFAHRAIAEFQSATIMQYSTGFLVIIVILLLGFLHRAPRYVQSFQFVYGGALVIAALAIVKFLPMAVIFLGAVTAEIWRREHKSRKGLGELAEGVERLRKLTERIPSEGLSFVLLCLAVVNVHQAWSAPLNTSTVPVEAVDYILKHHLPHPILNDFGHGGYLMYRLSDADGNLDHPVAIDGRTNVTPQSIYDKFEASFQGRTNWQEYLDTVKPTTILWRTESPLTSILLAGDKWCLVFRRGDATTGHVVFLSKEQFVKRKSELTSENCH